MTKVAAGSTALVVCGMHRSGTSLTTSLLGRAGVRLSDEQIPADRHNRHGYFEDAEVVALHREMLAEATHGGHAGHPDWGWTEDEVFHVDVFHRYKQRAVAIVEKRSKEAGLWGFKDPRATVALDLWSPLLGENARYVFAYRGPWDVADSMQRLGAEVFLRRPDYAHHIWGYYNRRILSFLRKHRDRCLVVNTTAMQEDPKQLIDLARERLCLEGAFEASNAVEGILKPEEFRATRLEDPLAFRTLDAYPMVREVWQRLQEEADLPMPGRLTSPTVSLSGSSCQGTECDPQVSVVTPCLNHGELLLEAVSSVESITEVSCEVVIVDDGSTADETIRILDRLRAAGHRVIAAPHRGLSAARNVGVAAAKADYILALDADNRIRPGFLKDATATLDETPEIGVVYGDRWDFGLHSGLAEVGPFDLPRILWRNYIDACALFRKSAWADAGGYDESLDFYEDWAFWIAVADVGWSFAYREGAAFDYRVRPGSLTHVNLLGLEADARERARSLRRRVRDRHRLVYQRHMPELERRGYASDL